MNRSVSIALGVLGVALFGALTAAVFAESQAKDYMMVGVIVAEDNVALEAVDQRGATDAIMVEEVLAPDDSWLVIHLDDNGSPGMRVGLAAVSPGVSKDVRVELDDEMLTDTLFVALHADRGKRGEFEFAMDMFHKSPDKPYFVGFEEVARRVAIK